MPVSRTWLQAITLGVLINFVMFMSLTTLSRKPGIKVPNILTVEFRAWQEPQQVKPRPTPLKKILKPKKKPVRKRELSLAEPVKAPPPPEELVEDTVAIATDADTATGAAMPIPVPIFEVSSLPRFVHRETPVYPPAMKTQGREGVVLIEALIDARGRVRKVAVIESAGEAFDQAAIAAIRGSTFLPANTNGSPVPVLLRVPIRFRLL